MIDRVHNLAVNVRSRGVGYLGAVTAYRAHALWYRVAALSPRRVTPKSAPIPSFHFDGNSVRAIADSVPKAARLLAIVEADQALEQRFWFRALPEIHFPETIDWNFAPAGNLSWSWDLNRLRYFLSLGSAYHYTQDAKYREKLESLWQDWMRHNPAGQGSNWSAAFEVAARLRNWIWAYFLLAASPGESSGFLPKAWIGLCEHAEFLAHHLEYHWPNNHLLLECLSLCEFAVVFRGFGGERFLTLASRILVRQVKQQILADGVHAELCPMYHEIVASELLVFEQLCRKLQYQLPIDVEERIQATRKFSASIRRSDGSFPLLGDSSSPDTCLRFDESQSATRDLAYWVWPAKETAQPVAGLAPALDLFVEAGYAILRGGAQQSHLIFDVGPWSRCETTHHGHADALSFELHALGRPWIVDSGFFYPWGEPEAHRSKQGSKSGGQSWSLYFRNTSAHNTVQLNGNDQSERVKPGNLGEMAKTRLASYRSTLEEVAACGEIQLYWCDGQTIHKREIVLNRSGGVTVCDAFPQLSSLRAGTCRVQSFLHFAVDLSVELSGPNLVVASDGDRMLTCEVSCAGFAPRLRLIRGQVSPRQGWVALSSATVAAAWVLAVEGEAVLPCEICFRFTTGRTAKGTRKLCASGKA